MLLTRFIKKTMSSDDSMLAIEATTILDVYLDSIGEHPEEYTISTPINWNLSSDDEEHEVVFKTSMKSACAVSDASTMSLTSQSEPVLPKEVLETIKRQDDTIQQLTTWCRTLTDHSKMHHLLLAEQGLSQAEARQDNQVMQQELAQLKASSTLRAKEIGLQINELNHNMQESLDGRMSLCRGKVKEQLSRLRQASAKQDVPRQASGTSATSRVAPSRNGGPSSHPKDHGRCAGKTLTRARTENGDIAKKSLPPRAPAGDMKSGQTLTRARTEKGAISKKSLPPKAPTGDMKSARTHRGHSAVSTPQLGMRETRDTSDVAKTPQSPSQNSICRTQSGTLSASTTQQAMLSGASTPVSPLWGKRYPRKLKTDLETPEKDYRPHRAASPTDAPTKGLCSQEQHCGHMQLSSPGASISVPCFDQHTNGSSTQSASQSDTGAAQDRHAAPCLSLLQQSVCPTSPRTMALSWTPEPMEASKWMGVLSPRAPPPHPSACFARGPAPSGGALTPGCPLGSPVPTRRVLMQQMGAPTTLQPMCVAKPLYPMCVPATLQSMCAVPTTL